MSSQVYYKFKSSKEPSRVVFDGSSISVFDLKREIIVANKLGNGSEFDLAVYDDSTNEEYTDDNAFVPRSTSVTVRRLPAARPGRGSAARYVSGNPANIRRHTTKAVPLVEYKPPIGEDNLSAFFSASLSQWEQTQESLASQRRVKRAATAAGSVPDKPVPVGYICYRCGEKGHWIQACPTNDDPQYDKRQVKRTTGIPRAFLQTVERPAEGSSSVMVNSDGEFVVARPDESSWATYKAQTTAALAFQKPTDPELVCGICSRLVVDAVRTPCCRQLFCEECIHSSLFEHDFACPSCGTNDILLDVLVPDEDIRQRAAAYAKKRGDSSDTPVVGDRGDPIQENIAPPVDAISDVPPPLPFPLPMMFLPNPFIQFPNQQPYPEDSPYLRKPVNDRHRTKRARPSDYRQVM